VGFGIQLLMFASPVIFPMSLVAEHPTMLTVLQLNPMTPVIEGVRAMFFGGSLDWAGLGYSAAFAAVVMAVALVVFHKVEQYFADIV
jgi:lipopolysaccharide transport system permease protein